jgi:peptidylprolyl isomerase
MKYTLLILLMAAGAAAAVAQAPTTPAATPATGTKTTATKPGTAKTATSKPAATKAAATKTAASKLPPEQDADGNPIFYPDAPAKLANIHCATPKTCVLKLPAGIPPASASLQDAFSLRYQDITIGTGAVAAPGMKYKLYYTGWNASDGTKFDSTSDHPHALARDKDGKPEKDANGKDKLSDELPSFSFTEGEGRVIPGMDLGMIGMRVGGKRRIVIPYQLAYGVRGRRGPNAAHPGVYPKSDLLFDVELLDVTDPNFHAKPAPKPDATKPAAPAQPQPK